MYYIDLDCIPSEVVTIHEYNDGVGCIYVSTRADSRVGVAIRLLDSNCNIIMKSNVKFKKINLFSIRNPIYENGKFYLLASRDVVFTKENNECFNLIIINDDGSYEISDIKTDEILNEKFFDTYLNKNMQSYLTSFNLLNKLKNSANKIKLFLNKEERQLLDSNYKLVSKKNNDYNSDYFSRVLYNINSFEPFDITYTGIKYDKQDARSIYSIEKYEDNIFMTGRILYDENLFIGLETGLYLSTGGEQQKIAIARVFYKNCPYIILDEPSAFLDYPSKEELMDLLRYLAHSYNKAILLSSHDLDIIRRYADRYWIMEKNMGEARLRTSPTY